jgi:hypothetical protein
MHQVKSLAAAGLSVVFVTNAAFLRPEAMEALKLICAGIIIRRNVGYDFGAWREGLAQLGVPRDNTAMVVLAVALSSTIVLDGLQPARARQRGMAQILGRRGANLV